VYIYMCVHVMLKIKRATLHWRALAYRPTDTLRNTMFTVYLRGLLLGNGKHLMVKSAEGSIHGLNEGTSVLVSNVLGPTQGSSVTIFGVVTRTRTAGLSNTLPDAVRTSRSSSIVC
jgi:hypothetical protein